MLREWLPSSIGLGSDERPPLVPLTRMRNWQLGTDRSAYARYRLYFIATAQSRLRSPPEHARPPADPHRSAHAEIVRTCSGFGLQQPAHRMASRSVASAAADTAAVPLHDATRIWKEWQAESHPIVALTAKMRLWLECANTAHVLVQRHGPVDS
jgi:hypothetical protein